MAEDTGTPTQQTQAAAEPTFEQETGKFVALDQGGAAVEKKAAATANTDTAEEAETETVESGDETAEAGEQKPAQKTNTAKGRIQQLVSEKRASEARERALEARLAALENNGLTNTERSDTSATTDEAPKPDDYPYGELDQGFIDAKVDYRVKQALKADREEVKKTEQKSAAEKRHGEMLEKAKAFEIAGAEVFDDFNDVVIEGARNGDYPVSAVLAELIFDSDVGTKVAYHLASNPKEAREIASLSANKQAAYFGRLEAKFSSESSGAAREQTAQARTTQAPPPPKTSVRGGGSKTGTPSLGSFAEFEAHMRAAAK